MGFLNTAFILLVNVLVLAAITVYIVNTLLGISAKIGDNPAEAVKSMRDKREVAKAAHAAKVAERDELKAAHRAAKVELKEAHKIAKAKAKANALRKAAEDMEPVVIEGLVKGEI